MNMSEVQEYKLLKESLSMIQDQEFLLFENEFVKSSTKNSFKISFNQRGYTVNDKVES